MEKRVNVKLRGLVQGIGFRMFVVREASSLGLSGWTRNLPDGSVEIEAEGTAGMLEDLLKQVNIGPSRSRVTSMTVREIELTDTRDGFRILD